MITVYLSNRVIIGNEIPGSVEKTEGRGHCVAVVEDFYPERMIITVDEEGQEVQTPNFRHIVVAASCHSDALGYAISKVLETKPEEVFQVKYR